MMRRIFLFSVLALFAGHSVATAAPSKQECLDAAEFCHNWGLYCIDFQLWCTGSIMDVEYVRDEVQGADEMLCNTVIDMLDVARSSFSDAATHYVAAEQDFEYAANIWDSSMPPFYKAIAVQAYWDAGDAHEEDGFNEKYEAQTEALEAIDTWSDGPGDNWGFDPIPETP